MTAKEKAIELYYSFEEYVESTDTTDNVTISDFELKKQNQKQCALICVDEILNINSVYKDYDLSNYWEEVKSEINLL